MDVVGIAHPTFFFFLFYRQGYAAGKDRSIHIQVSEGSIDRITDIANRSIEILESTAMTGFEVVGNTSHTGSFYFISKIS